MFLWAEPKTTLQTCRKLYKNAGRSELKVIVSLLRILPTQQTEKISLKTKEKCVSQRMTSQPPPITFSPRLCLPCSHYISSKLLIWNHGSNPGNHSPDHLDSLQSHSSRLLSAHTPLNSSTSHWWPFHSKSWVVQLFLLWIQSFFVFLHRHRVSQKLPRGDNDCCNVTSGRKLVLQARLSETCRKQIILSLLPHDVVGTLRFGEKF